MSLSQPSDWGTLVSKCEMFPWICAAMKPMKISAKGIVLTLVCVGLIADLLPYPGLSPGLVARTTNWLVTTLQPQTPESSVVKQSPDVSENLALSGARKSKPATGN
jgi:hypothetical protein